MTTEPTTTETAAELALAAQTACVAVAMVMNAAQAREHLASIPPAAITDPINRWVARSVSACVRAGVDPDPVTVAEAARREGIEPPPALRGTPVSFLFSLIAPDALPVPGNAEYFARITRASHIRRKAQRATEAIGAAVWAGSLDDLRTVVAGHLAALTNAIDVEVGGQND